VNGADAALESAVSLLDQATQWGAQGANSTQTAGTRGDSGAAVGGALESRWDEPDHGGGALPFSGGDQDGRAGVRIEYSQPERGKTGAYQRQYAPGAGCKGARLRGGQDGAGIFDHGTRMTRLAPDNVFAAVKGLPDGRWRTTNTAAITAIDGRSAHSRQLPESQLSFYGAAQDLIQTAKTDAAEHCRRGKRPAERLEDTISPPPARRWR